ncbi:MAG: VCBS domain-containing protein, partial [Methyloligellaceae bacterium]
TDVDASDTHTFTIDTTGTLGSVTNNGDGSFTYNPNGAFEALAEGETTTDSFIYTVDDGHGGIATQTATVTITGQNDAPVILAGGDVTGDVVEDTVISVSGSLTATDVDNSAILGWTLSGGASGAIAHNVIGNVDYTFQVDQFNVTRNGASLYSDDFADGIAPPAGGFFPNGTVAEYNVSGEFTESNGYAVMDGSQAGPTQSALFTSTPFLGHFATLRTDVSNDPADLNRGLKYDDDFTLDARFDLTAPDENREAYGIRLSDRMSSNPAQQGDDVMELVVVRGSDGILRVRFSERDFTTGENNIIDAALLDTTGADQIVLRLDHSAATPGVVTASFDLLNAGSVINTVTLTNTGQIFGTETPGDTSDDEAWTRAQIIAFSPGEVTGSSLQGNYGVLSIDQQGDWIYDLDNSSPVVQALAAGEVVTDTFTAIVADEFGATDSQEIVITVTGTNDAPVVADISGNVNEDGPSIILMTDFTDVDTSDTHIFTIDTTGTLGSVINNNDGTFTYNPNGAFESLAEGETVVDTFNYTVDDGNGGIDTKTATVTITGQNDEPVALAITDTANEDGPSIALTADFSDIDASDAHTFTIDTTGTLGSVTNNNDSTFIYSPNGAFESLGHGETAVDTFTYTVDDGNGGVDTKTATVNITGQNDAPVILAGGDTTGDVEVDTTFTTSGNLSATDIDSTATLGWILTDGAPGQFANNVIGDIDYHFEIDQFTVTRNGEVFFQDNFDDGIAPPSGGTFSNGYPATYSTYSTFTESNGRAVMDGSQAISIYNASIYTSIPFAGHFARLESNNSNDPAYLEYGLKNDDDITLEARFDLAIPDERFEAYGIRLTDTNPNDPNQPGDDTMELVVRREADNSIKVLFTERDAITGTNEEIDSFILDATAQELDQIVLRLEDSLENPGVVIASFDLYDQGVIVASETLDNTGQIFGTETPGDISDDEIWTQAQIISYSPGTVSSSTIQGNYGTLTIDHNGDWTYNLDNDNSDVQALDEGETLTDTFTAVIADEYNATDSREIAITITGQNDAPVILEGGDVTGDVIEDTIISASGTLVATDIDPNSTLTWSLEGGAAGATAQNIITNIDYNFQVDKFNVVKNGTNIFTDDFDDNIPAPNGGLFSDGSVAHYLTGGEFTEAGGRAIMDGSLSGPSRGAAFTTTPYNAHYALLDTNISNDIADIDQGLKQDDDFTVEVTFDLVLPDEFGEGYGIHLADYATAIGLPGDDVVAIEVVHGSNGQTFVLLRDRDYAAGALTILDGYPLDPTGADQIVLRLEHSASNIGVVTGSFDLLSAGSVVSSYTFGNTGQIFGTQTPGDTTDNELWTRANIVSFSPGVKEGQTLAGDYGTLSIGLDGNWTYDLNNDSPLVQALAEGEAVTETFTVVVADEHGASDSQELVITVTGTNDAPVITAIDAGTVSEDDTVLTIDLLDGQTDVDNGAVLSVANIVATDNLGNPVVFMNNGDGTISIDPDQYGEALATGESRTVTVTYEVTDGIASTANTASVVIEGAADNVAPVAGDDSFTTSEDTPLTGNVLLDNGNGADSDGNGDVLSVIAGTFSTIQGGTVVLNTDGSFSYTPAENYSGQDSFDYTLTDGQENDTATVTIDIEPVADPVTISLSEYVLNTNSIVANQSTPGNQVYSDIGVLEDGTLVVTWVFGRNIFARLFDESGAPISGDFQVNDFDFVGTTEKLRPQIVALEGNDFSIVWGTEKDNTPGVYGRNFSGDNDLGPAFLIGQPNWKSSTKFLDEYETVSLGNGKYGVIYDFYVNGQIDPGEVISYAVVNTDGVVESSISDLLQLDSPIDPAPDNVNILDVTKLSNGNLLLLWDSRGIYSYMDGMFVQEITPDGQIVGSRIEVDNDSNYDSIVGHAHAQIGRGVNGETILAFEIGNESRVGNPEKGLYIRIFDADGNQTFEQVIYNGLGARNMKMVQMENDSFFLTWQSDQNGVPNVLGHKLNADGTPQGDIINLSTYASSEVGLVAQENGNVALTWTNYFNGQDAYLSIINPENFDNNSLTGYEDNPFLLPVTAELNDVDGSETIGDIVISGLPQGFALNFGTQNPDSSWTLTEAQLNGLQILPASDYNGSFTINISVQSVESANNDTATSQLDIPVNILPVNDAPVTVAIDAGTVSEDDTVLTIDLLDGQTDVDNGA